ncbi:hypothetical protein ACM66B_003201 [Microbotryomycetes sp. NB124-2]
MSHNKLVLPAAQLGRHAATSAHVLRDGPRHTAFVPLSNEFQAIIRFNSSLELIASTETALGGSGVSLFHEAGVWAPDQGGSSTGDVYITSNIISGEDDSREIKVCRLRIKSELKAGAGVALKASTNAKGILVAAGVEYEDLDDIAQDVIMANGATAYGDKILWCSQGQHLKLPKRAKVRLSSQSQDRQPGALMLTNIRESERSSQALLNNFFGREFNALNDVAVHRQSGAIFFTDPDYGIKQGFKNPSQLPNGVWRFMPSSGSLSMVADGIQKPNGIVCSPDGKTCYVTDTDFIHGDGSMDPTRPGTM